MGRLFGARAVNVNISVSSSVEHTVNTLSMQIFLQDVEIFQYPKTIDSFMNLILRSAQKSEEDACIGCFNIFVHFACAASVSAPHECFAAMLRLPIKLQLFSILRRLCIFYCRLPRYNPRAYFLNKTSILFTMKGKQ